LEIDRSARIFVPRRLRERIAVDSKIAIIALRDQLESRSPEEWNSLDLLSWAEPVQETPAPDAALELGCMEGRGSKVPR
jgi:DNA-binding transcriptional regulator/RsmH inhibitor MraZ